MKVAETPDLPFVLRLSVEQHKRQNQQIYILCLQEKSPLPFDTFVIYYCNSWISMFDGDPPIERQRLSISDTVSTRYQNRKWSRFIDSVKLISRKTIPRLTSYVPVACLHARRSDRNIAQLMSLSVPKESCRCCDSDLRWWAFNSTSPILSISGIDFEWPLLRRSSVRSAHYKMADRLPVNMTPSPHSSSVNQTTIRSKRILRERSVKNSPLMSLFKPYTVITSVRQYSCMT